MQVRKVLIPLSVLLVVTYCTEVGAEPRLTKDRSTWSQSPEVQGWYKKQVINPEAKKRMRLRYDSCCDAGDVFRTRFRLIEDGSTYGAETYEYEQDGVWKVVPPDIIRRDKTPDGRPVLFVRGGLPLCFIIDEDGN